MADWSTLLSELVRCVADRLLDTNDIDLYMILPAVCPSWRSAYDDPRNSSEPRFRPCRWIVVRRALRLRQRLAPHGEHRQRPRRPASAPQDIACNRYVAAPSTRDFSRDLDEDVSWLVLMQLAIPDGIYATTGGWQRREAPLPVALADRIFRVMKLFDIDPYKMYSHKLLMGFADLSWAGNSNCFFLVESAGEILAIVNVQPHLKVFRLLDTDGDELQPVERIGGRAIFIGYRRCLSVNADKFPSAIAKCIYYFQVHRFVTRHLLV
ncbi:hypothetical protein ZWY2020_030082 [Hordeum vulgare]|nr:hypothetical protein ZWY2020_030082 [Hordeum vulgare]